MFKKRDDKNPFKPMFKVDLEEEIIENPINKRNCYNATFYSRTNVKQDWQQEYRIEGIPITSVSIFFDIVKILDTIKENYFNFRSKRFHKQVMFCAHGVMYKNPSIDYATKELTGTIINERLLQYMPVYEEMVFDAIGSASFIQFYEENEPILLGNIIYCNGEIKHILEDEEVKKLIEMECVNGEVILKFEETKH